MSNDAPTVQLGCQKDRVLDGNTQPGIVLSENKVFWTLMCSLYEAGLVSCWQMSMRVNIVERGGALHFENGSNKSHVIFCKTIHDWSQTEEVGHG